MPASSIDGTVSEYWANLCEQLNFIGVEDMNSAMDALGDRAPVVMVIDTRARSCFSAQVSSVISNPAEK